LKKEVKEMKKSIFMGVLILFALMLLTGGTVSALPVESGGWAQLDYSVSGVSSINTEYQHTHAEAGFDISTGTPISTDDNYTQPLSSAHAATSHSSGKGDAVLDTNGNYLWAENFASADGLASESWGYVSTIYKIGFNLSEGGTVGIGYDFSGSIFANSTTESGSAFSVALASIWIDNYSSMLYDSDPEWDDYVEVVGIGSQAKTLAYSGLIDYDFLAGDHEIIFTLDTYANAAVPEPATMLLLGSGLIGLAGFRRKFKKS